MIVRISITGGSYAGKGNYEGELASAPVTSLVPEGIVSARTTEEADRLRSSIGQALVSAERVVISAASWQITADRIEA